MHVRQTIAAGVKTVLSASPTNWQRVFGSRFSPSRDITPYLLVYVESEEVTVTDIHPSFLQERDITINIRGRYRMLDMDARETLEEKLAAIQAEVETTLTLTALQAEVSGVKSLYLSSVSLDMVEDEYDRATAEVALDWQAKAYTTEGAPESFV